MFAAFGKAVYVECVYSAHEHNSNKDENHVKTALYLSQSHCSASRGRQSWSQIDEKLIIVSERNLKTVPPLQSAFEINAALKLIVHFV